MPGLRETPASARRSRMRREAARLFHRDKGFSIGNKGLSIGKGLASMRKIGSSSLAIGASIVAVTAGILLAHEKSGQVADKVADAGSAPIPDRPDWNWDVRPILAQNCFSCHGQSTQKAGLRLDIQKAAYDPIPEDKNKRAIVPGNPGKSELYKRIISTNADYRMPPKEAHKTLSAHDVAVIERWITQGAVYKPHWAYVTPDKTRWDSQAVDEIDRHVYARLA